jgi:two-component sensor histidine kinase
MEGDTRRLSGANAAALSEFSAASVILIPVRVEGRWTGLMALADSRPRQFTAADRRLARLLSGQAEVILANNRLYEQARVMLNIREKLIEQTRRDAQTKAILLREVHHRVKNNLSGIIGLLSMRGGIELPEAANQWLFRVIERIGNMARAHELFSTASERVELGQLIEQVLPSLSVIKPIGVEVRAEVDAGDRITLPTTQGVSLAMVLHELASNAILHGLAGRDYGHVTIRATRTPRNTAMVEVIDDGVGMAEEAQEPRRGAGESDGLGLQLVSDLVRRELRGSFKLSPNVGGGATAALEFPLQPFQETQGV